MICFGKHLKCAMNHTFRLIQYVLFLLLVSEDIQQKHFSRKRSQLLELIPTTQLMTGDIRACPDLTDRLADWSGPCSVQVWSIQDSWSAPRWPPTLGIGWKLCRGILVRLCLRLHTQLSPPAEPPQWGLLNESVQVLRIWTCWAWNRSQKGHFASCWRGRKPRGTTHMKECVQEIVNHIWKNILNKAGQCNVSAYLLIDCLRYQCPSRDGC